MEMEVEMIRLLFLSGGVFSACLGCAAPVSADGCRTSREVVISDIAAAAGETSWRTIPYETRDGIKGRMLYAPCGLPPHQYFKVPLPVRGRYRIVLGLCGVRYLLGENAFRALVRLERDPAPVIMDAAAPVSEAGWWMQPVENEWKTVDLDGDTLVFGNMRNARAALAWIRLVPAGPARDVPRAFDMIATNDAYEPLEGLDEVFAPIMRLKDSPVKEIHYCCANGAYAFRIPSRIAISTDFTPEAVYENSSSRAIAESYARTSRAYPDLLDRLVDFTHAQGMKFMVSFRTGPVLDHMRLSEMTGKTRRAADGFDIAARENLCELFDGTTVARFSYARKEVQDWFLRLYAEKLASKADGLSLIWIRALPAMLFEPAFRERFRAAYGEELRDENDPRVKILRAEIMTGFHRRVRALLGKRKFTVFVPPDPETCADFGLDLRRLAQEGIVDEFVAGNTKQTANHDEAFSFIDFAFFRSACAGTSATFRTYFWGLLPDYLTSVSEGAAGVAYWDAAAKPWRLWEETRLLDDRDGVKAKAWKAANPPAARVRPFKTLDGFDYARYPWHVAY